MKIQEINFFIHDLNERGGQERSTMEILQNLSHSTKIHLYAYTYSPSTPIPNLQFYPCPLKLNRPAVIKIIVFQLWSLWIKFSTPTRLTFSTGTASLYSHVVHVQFLASAWKIIAEQTKTQQVFYRRIYHAALRMYNTWLESILFDNTRLLIPISKTMQLDLSNLLGQSNNTVIRHGVNATIFEPCTSQEQYLLRQKLQLPQDKSIILFVGAFDRKGLKQSLEGLAKTDHANKNIHFLAVGSGDQDYYRSLSNTLGLKEVCEFRKPQSNIQDYFKAANIFLFPTTYEPFGLVILEAMSSGLATITTSKAGAAELIQNGKNGLVIQSPPQPAEITAALNLLLDDTELVKTLGTNARATAIEHSWQNVAQSFDTLITKHVRL
jgi:glycosyltransferase involved in cell wall biosynthesis